MDSIVFTIGIKIGKTLFWFLFFYESNAYLFELINVRLAALSKSKNGGVTGETVIILA